MSHIQKPTRVYFGSDFHFGHHNVITHSNRPFQDIEEMTEVLIGEWNDVIEQQDTVYVLGDFSFFVPNVTTAILKRLKGQKVLVRGNHDHQSDLKLTKGWMKVVEKLEIRIDQDRIVLDHFPHLSWNQSHRGAYHLHGHCHGTMRYPDEMKRARIMDVGIDPLNQITGHYRPIEWPEVKALLEKRISVSLDCHEPRD